MCYRTFDRKMTMKCVTRSLLQTLLHHLRQEKENMVVQRTQKRLPEEKKNESWKKKLR